MRGRTQKTAKYDTKKVVALAAVAVVVVAGSFGFASGMLSQDGGSLIASVAAAITGQPTLFVSVDQSSPAGSIAMGQTDTIAVFDVRTQNVTHWTTVSWVPVQVTITASANASLSISSFAMKYTYCIPQGATYGYGYVSSGCGSISLFPTSVSANGTSYVATFSTGIPVYPQQSSGTLKVTAVPLYAYTGSATKSASNATLSASISGIRAAGDQCQWTYNSSSRSYGYTNCVSRSAIINVQSNRSPVLTILRPYGYGYTGQNQTQSITTIINSCSGNQTVSCLQTELQNLIKIINGTSATSH